MILFRYEIKRRHIVVYVLGIKFKIKKIEYFIETARQRWSIIRQQNRFNTSQIKNAKQLVVFILPHQMSVTGGILSIFNICKYTRKYYPYATCILSTPPGNETYFHNNYFENDENIYRWEQVIKNIKGVNDIIFHVPEYMSKYIFKDIAQQDLKVLRNVKSLQINILNQNIELMPTPAELKDLYAITSRVTQTLAFKKNATQQLADQYKMPVHLISTFMDYSNYETYPFHNKSKIIAISKDFHPQKQNIVDRLKRQLPDYQIVIIDNISFEEYMKLIAQAMFVLTFGEGFDFYFIQPSYVGTVSFSVYNENFFPDSSWLSFENVYSSYNMLSDNIIVDIKKLSQNEEKYYEVVNKTQRHMNDYYGENLYIKNIVSFYKKEYHLLPQGRR